MLHQTVFRHHARFFFPTLLLTASLLWTSALLAQVLPPAPGSRVVDLTPQPGFHDEPSIAIDPSDPAHLVAAWQVTATAAYSTDGGAHWTVAKNTAPKDYRMSGDVSVTFDNHGHAYLCYIAFDKLGTDQYWGHNATRNGIFVRRSLDGGKTWEPQAETVFAHSTQPGIPFEDKPIIVADTSNGPYAGNLYVGWTQFTESQSLLVLSRSTDGGKSWTAPKVISTRPGLPRDDNGSVEGFTGAVARDGTLYVAWADRDGITFTSSHDGGKTFEPSRTVIPTAPLFFTVVGVDRANGFPVMTIDDRPGHPERLYLTWSDYRNGDVDVFTSSSTDHGRTWSDAVRVNNDPLHNGIDQFFAWSAVDSSTGALYVDFYDRRISPKNRDTTVSLARSTDGGKTFQNYAWTTEPFDAEGRFIGDYIGLAAHAGRVYGIWAEQRKLPGQKGHAARPVRGEEPAASQIKNATVVRVGIANFEATN